MDIPPAPWCVARSTLYFDTHLHGILPREDINRNGNIFFSPRIVVITTKSGSKQCGKTQYGVAQCGVAF